MSPRRSTHRSIRRRFPSCSSCHPTQSRRRCCRNLHPTQSRCRSPRHCYLSPRSPRRGSSPTIHTMQCSLAPQGERRSALCAHCSSNEWVSRQLPFLGGRGKEPPRAILLPPQLGFARCSRVARRKANRTAVALIFFSIPPCSFMSRMYPACPLARAAEEGAEPAIERAVFMTSSRPERTNGGLSALLRLSSST
jgi:hypothetical protein